MEDQTAIVHGVLVDKESNIDAARKHRVTPALVSCLVSKAKKCPSFFDQLRQKEEKREMQSRLVKVLALKDIQAGKPIEKAADIKAKVAAEFEVEVPLKRVCQIFRQEMGLKYKMIKNIAWQGNSERNMVLRQQFAIRMLALLQQGKRIINVDESWLSHTDFRRRKWKAHGMTNSVPRRNVNPRISCIGAVDTEGDVYLSLTQKNTDNMVMKLFLSRLALQLDRDRPGWQKDSFLMLDGAAYHLSQEIQTHLSNLDFPVIYTGPRSYDASPAERLWAALKTVDLNPADLKCGKR